MTQRAIDKIVRGALKYRTTGLNKSFKEELARMRKDTKPKDPRNVALFVTCMDARLHPGVFTQTDSYNAVYRIRNAGNIIPNQEMQQKTEANPDKSDCKAKKIKTNYSLLPRYSPNVHRIEAFAECRTLVECRTLTF